MAGCAVGGGGEPTGRMESRIDYEPISTFKNNILTIDATQRDGTRVRLNTLRDAESTVGVNRKWLIFVKSKMAQFR